MPTFENILRYQDELENTTLRFGESWIPSHLRTYNTPPPIPQESLSSWILRYSTLLRQSPLRILQYLGAKKRESHFWLDFDANALPWEEVSVKSSLEVRTIRNLVPNWGRFLNLPELFCLQADLMRMRPQLRFCDQCLATDPTPFFRQSWRLSSTWLCPTHRTALHDACPHCNVPLCSSHYSIRRVRVANLRFCPACGGDMCAVPECAEIPVWLALEVISIQQQFEYLLSRADPSEVRSASPERNSPTPELTFEQVRAELLSVLRTVPFNCGNAVITDLFLGIAADRLFGKKTGHICSYFFPRQSLFGTTVWWPGGVFYKDAFKTRWLRSDYDRARQWMLALGAQTN